MARGGYESGVPHWHYPPPPGAYMGGAPVQYPYGAQVQYPRGGSAAPVQPEASGVAGDGTVGSNAVSGAYMGSAPVQYPLGGSAAPAQSEVSGAAGDGAVGPNAASGTQPLNNGRRTTGDDEATSGLVVNTAESVEAGDVSASGGGNRGHASAEGRRGIKHAEATPEGRPRRGGAQVNRSAPVRRDGPRRVELTFRSRRERDEYVTRYARCLRRSGLSLRVSQERPL